MTTRTHLIALAAAVLAAGASGPDEAIATALCLPTADGAAWYLEQRRHPSSPLRAAAAGLDAAVVRQAAALVQGGALPALDEAAEQRSTIARAAALFVPLCDAPRGVLSRVWFGVVAGGRIDAGLLGGQYWATHAAAAAMMEQALIAALSQLAPAGVCGRCGGATYGPACIACGRHAAWCVCHPVAR